MQNFTVKEQKAIDRLQRAFLAMPDSIRLYCVDMDILACKVGVSARDLDALVGMVRDTGAVLTDLHDANGHGAPNNASTRTSGDAPASEESSPL